MEKRINNSELIEMLENRKVLNCEKKSWIK